MCTRMYIRATYSETKTAYKTHEITSQFTSTATMQSAKKDQLGLRPLDGRRVHKPFAVSQNVRETKRNDRSEVT